MTRRERAERLRGIYAIVNEGARDPVELTRDILAGGARIVQYRAKNGIVAEHARQLRSLTREFRALLFLNDDWRAVREYDADGVHLGPEDATAAELPAIRAALADALIGLSCGTEAEAREALRADADYVGAGSVYATASKDDAGDPIGLDGLRRVAAAAAPLPVAAIGGVTAGALGDVRATGVAMAAVISAIARAPDARAATEALVRAWEAGR